MSGLSFKVKEEKELVWKSFLTPKGIHPLCKSKYLLLNHTEMAGWLSTYFRGTFGTVQLKIYRLHGINKICFGGPHGHVREKEFFSSS